jgi:hypothetical protein
MDLAVHRKDFESIIKRMCTSVVSALTTSNIRWPYGFGSEISNRISDPKDTGALTKYIKRRWELFLILVATCFAMHDKKKMGGRNAPPFYGYQCRYRPNDSSAEPLRGVVSVGPRIRTGEADVNVEKFVTKDVP